MSQNPYNWTLHTPTRPVVRAELLADLSRRLRRRTGCVLLGGRGMGKSVLLQQVGEQIQRDDASVRVVRFEGPPTPPTLSASVKMLGDRLGVAKANRLQLEELFEEYFAQRPGVSSCVLLFDELDQYATPHDRHSLGRQLFNRLEAVRKSTRGRIGILAAGGLGIYVLRDVLGSAFMSRVYYAHPSLFSAAEIEELSEPFAERGTPLSEDVRKAIHLASGGNPALVTYGLERLWERSGRTERDVAAIYARFASEYPDFVQSIRDSIAHPSFSEAPLRVWERIRVGSGEIPRAELLEAAATESGKLRMDLRDILRLLRSAGLISGEGTTDTDDPLRVRATASILNLPAPSERRGGVIDLLREDLISLLSSIHDWSPDFFRPGLKGDAKIIVPECVFTAFLGMGLLMRGWAVEREAVQGAGRTDLKLKRHGGTVVVETKLWDRTDYKEVQGQVEGYWSGAVRAAAVVMISDAGERSFNEEQYRRRCLSRADLKVTEAAAPPPLRGRFVVESTTAQGFAARVEHILLRLPRD
ncbi:MAG: ATP-binding protein [Polyangiaceae bacterium]|nr:ATP-binding protein [Polyangiaceae bacterium]